MVSSPVGERKTQHAGQSCRIAPADAGNVMKNLDAKRRDNAVRASGTGTPDEGAAGQETN